MCGFLGVFRIFARNGRAARSAGARDGAIARDAAARSARCEKFFAQRAIFSRETR
jgi:hypothetical protein